ncbi:hypothetical protein [Burkholderia latens]|uniref:Uncharacterized protein n=1 Tax=Burkholderia latens TaxID=488446 RepID=A0A6H9TC25_9BURK|nr:hypothetical protein [Burkholderia latens]KAB0640525.1 hypothetical protein F7R21_16930 [Burkholderia latens]
MMVRIGDDGRGEDVRLLWLQAHRKCAMRIDANRCESARPDGYEYTAAATTIRASRPDESRNGNGAMPAGIAPFVRQRAS